MGVASRLCLLLAVLAAASPLVLAGFQNSDVGKSTLFHDTVPRFRGAKGLNVETSFLNGSLSLTAPYTTPEGSTGTLMDYAINVAILSGVGLLFAILCLLWVFFRCLCGRCCHCWRCNCCCRRGRKVTGAAVVLVFFLMAVFAFCVLGYLANTELDEAIDSDSGLSSIVPGFFTLALQATGTLTSAVTTIATNGSNIIGDVAVFLNTVQNNITAGTQDLTYATGNLSANVAAATSTSGTFMVYYCAACSAVSSTVASLDSQVSSQAGPIVADFQDLASGLQDNLVSINSSIVDTAGSVKQMIGNVSASITSTQTTVNERVDQVKHYEYYRKLGFIILFLFPLITVPFVLGGFCCKRARANNLFTAAIYFTYIYVIFTLIVYAVHIPIATVLGDACVYGEYYETAKLKAESDKCGTSTDGSCLMYRYVDACLEGKGLLNVSNVTSQFDYHNLIQFPAIPDINSSFTFSDLTALTSLFSDLSVQDLGFPQCYMDTLRDRINGDYDPALLTTPPTTTTSQRQALWVQDKLGFGLTVPLASRTGTRLSFDRSHVRAAHAVNTTVVGLPVAVYESVPAQVHTITEQLTSLGVRHLHLQAHFLTASGTAAKHCNNSVNTPELRARLCSADVVRVSVPLRAACGSSNIPGQWKTCEAVCVCDFGDLNTGCPIDAPTLVDTLNEIKTWLDANPGELVTLHIDNYMVGVDSDFSAGLTSIFGALLHTPTPSTDYTNLANWATSSAIVAANKQIMVFTNPGGSLCGPTDTSPTGIANAFCSTLLQNHTKASFNAGSCSSSSTPPAFHYVTGPAVKQTLLLNTTNLGTDYSNGGAATLTSAGLASVYSCGYSPVLDQLDSTLAAAALWSFATGFPDGSLGTTSFGFVASPAGVFRFKNRADGTTSERCACRSTTNPSVWTVSTTGAFAACAGACAGGTAFAVPRSPWEMQRLKAVYTAASLTTEVVYVNLQFDAAMSTTIEGTSFGTYPDTAVANPAFGLHLGGLKTEAQIDASGSTDPLVVDFKKMYADRVTLQTKVTDVQADKATIVSVADSLPEVWYTVQTKTDTIKAQTEQLFTAADNALAVLDKCAGIDQQYLALKDSICNTMEEGVVGIAMAGFFIGFCGLASIFVFGAVIMSYKDPNFSPEGHNDGEKPEPDELSDYRREEEEFLNDGAAPPYPGRGQSQEWHQMEPVTKGFSAEY